MRTLAIFTYNVADRHYEILDRGIDKVKKYYHENYIPIEIRARNDLCNYLQHELKQEILQQKICSEFSPDEQELVTVDGKLVTNQNGDALFARDKKSSQLYMISKPDIEEHDAVHAFAVILLAAELVSQAGKDTRLHDISDFFIALDYPVGSNVSNNSDNWHVISRQGELYGGSVTPERSPFGSVAFGSLFRVDYLTAANAERFIQYVIMHELGHSIGNLRDCLENASDSVMKPLRRAADREMEEKIIVYAADELSKFRHEVEEHPVEEFQKRRRGNAVNCTP